MKTASEKAEEWLQQRHMADENFTYTIDDFRELIMLLKKQERDIRHACAEAVTYSDSVICRNEGPFISTADAEKECINVKAV